MYINVRKLYELAQANRKPNLLVGSLICNAVPIKDPHNKWFVPTYMFKEKKFPNYLSGTGYLMQREVARKLYSASLETPLFHLEDIYLTGILSRYTLQGCFPDLCYRNTFQVYITGILFRYTLQGYFPDLRYRFTFHVNVTWILPRCTLYGYFQDIRYWNTFQMYDTGILSRFTLQEYFPDVRYRDTFQVYNTGILY